ncbi:MAG: hypothetical protein U1E05_01440, partial [Patescibacteria group bacterium]|nr:hypothetical protein [Patescibacteria group bacterium]
MTEIRLDAISTLMPLGARSFAPVTEFAAYLDEAWTRSTTTTNTMNDPAARYSPTSAETRRDA